MILDAHIFINTHRSTTKLGGHVVNWPKVKFHWYPLAEQNVGDASSDRVKARSDPRCWEFSGIWKGKAFDGLKIAGECEERKQGFGEVVGNRLETWVQAATPDDDYRKRKRLVLEVS